MGTWNLASELSTQSKGLEKEVDLWLIRQWERK